MHIIELIPGTRMTVDWEGLITRQHLVQDRLTDSFTESLRLGNGDIGVAVYATPECLVLFAGKNDLLDYRAKPEAFSPDATASSLACTMMPSTKPAGWIRFRNAAPRNPDTPARLDIWNAEMSTFAADRGITELRAFVPRQRNLIATEYHPLSGEAFDIELARHKDSTEVIDTDPEFGAEGRDIWVRYQFPPDPDTFPDGFEYVMLGRVIGGEVISAEVIPEFGLSPYLGGGHWWRGGQTRDGTPTPWGDRRVWPVTESGREMEGVARLRMRSSMPVTFLTAIYTTRDDPDPLAAARAALDEAERIGFSELQREHRQTWHDFWQRSFVQLDGKDFLNQQWFLNLYHLASVTQPARVGPGLFGPWSPEDWPCWGNDRHWDYNVQAALWGAYSCNHLELTAAFNDEVFDLLPCAQMMVRDYYGNIGGAKYPGCSWPRHYTAPVSTRQAEWTSPWVNGFVAQPLWWYFQYSQDTTFLREKGYPVIKACAEFYEHFVERAPDGKYEMPPTGIWDLPVHVPDGRNSTMDLAFAKMLLMIATAASRALGVDQERRGNWEHVAANLRSYATTVIDGKNLKPVDHKQSSPQAFYTIRDFPSGEVLVTYENYPVIEYNLSPWTMPIFPAGDIGLHSPPHEQELALRTLQITPYYLWDDLVMLSMAWVRLGHDQLDIFEQHTRSIVHENGCQTYPRYLNESKYIFMHFLGWPVVVNESLVQSYTGQIRVAPVKLQHTARFARLRTEGAFLISGEIQRGGQVSYLAVTSEVGRPCHLLRPWDGPVRVRCLEAMEEDIPVREHDGVFTFPTTAGATYVVDRPADPWEAQAMTHIGVMMPDSPASTSV